MQSELMNLGSLKMATWTKWKNRWDAWWDQPVTMRTIIALIIVSVACWLFSKPIADLIFILFFK